VDSFCEEHAPGGRTGSQWRPCRQLLLPTVVEQLAQRGAAYW
jgi:hypothetical protein